MAQQLGRPVAGAGNRSRWECKTPNAAELGLAERRFSRLLHRLARTTSGSPGNGDGVVQKWSHDGSSAAAADRHGALVCDAPGGACASVGATGDSTHFSSSSPGTSRSIPTTATRHTAADGYGNHQNGRVRSPGKFLPSMGRRGRQPGASSSPGDGGHPHCVVMSRRGLIYACDRGNDRIQVFDKFGNAAAHHSRRPWHQCSRDGAGSAWDVDFSPDRAQNVHVRIRWRQRGDVDLRSRGRQDRRLAVSAAWAHGRRVHVPAHDGDRLEGATSTSARPSAGGAFSSS